MKPTFGGALVTNNVTFSLDNSTVMSCGIKGITFYSTQNGEVVTRVNAIGTIVGLFHYDENLFFTVNSNGLFVLYSQQTLLPMGQWQTKQNVEKVYQINSTHYYIRTDKSGYFCINIAVICLFKSLLKDKISKV